MSETKDTKGKNAPQTVEELQAALAEEQSKREAAEKVAEELNTKLAAAEANTEDKAEKSNVIKIGSKKFQVITPKFQIRRNGETHSLSVEDLKKDENKAILKELTDESKGYNVLRELKKED